MPYEQAYEEGFEDMPRRVPDLSKIRAAIGYEPKLNLEQIIASVIAHARATLPASAVHAPVAKERTFEPKLVLASRAS